MSATAIDRVYRVTRKTKIQGVKYQPTVKDPQFFRPGPEVSEGVLTNLVEHGSIEPYHGDLPNGAFVNGSAEDSAPARTRSEARKNAIENKAGKAKPKAAAKKESGDTPQRAAAKGGEDTKDAPSDGDAGDTKPKDQDPPGGDELRQFPGDGLPSDDPGKPATRPGGDNAPAGGTGNMQDAPTATDGKGSGEKKADPPSDMTTL